MSNQSGTDSQRGEITIDRHYIDSIRTYEVTEDQLMIVEAGSSGGTALNFCIALYSVFLSFVVSLVTTKIEAIPVLVVFWVVLSVTFILGTYFLIAWLRARKSSQEVFTKIRNQKSTSAIRDNANAINPIVNPSAEQSEDGSSR